jgi:mevalonate kinase
VNTEGLFKEFGEQYETLTSKSTAIVSCPATAMWSGEHSALYGGIAVCQPVSLRVWVGIEREDLEEAADLSTIELSPSSKDHVTFPPPGDKLAYLDWLASGEAGPGELANKIAPALQHMARRLLTGPSWARGRRLIVRSISEEPPGAGGNWSGAFAAAVAAAVLVVTGRLSDKTAHSWTKTPSAQLITDPLFMECVRTSWALESALHGGRASGYGPVCALIGGPHPIVYCTEERIADDYQGPGEATPPVDVRSNYEILDSIKLGFARLPEILGVDRGRGFPGFRCGLIHTGAPKDTGEAIISAIEEAKAVHTAEQKLLDRQLYEKGSLDEVAMRSLASRLRSHVKNLEDQRPFPLGIGSQMAGVARGSGHVLEALLALYETVGERSREESLRLVESLATRVRMLEAALEQLHLDWAQGRSVAAKIYESVGPSYERTGIKLTGGGRGGSLWFVIPDQPANLLKDIVGAVEGLAVYQYTAHMLWNSVDDKPEVAGVRVGDAWLKPGIKPVGIVSRQRAERFVHIWDEIHSSVPAHGVWYVDLTEYVVVGSYVRDASQCERIDKEIVGPIKSFFHGAQPGSSPEVWLLLGPSSAGKTALFEALEFQLARMGVKTKILDLSSGEYNEDSWGDAVVKATADDCPRLCVIDEIHSRLDSVWPYVALCNSAATTGRANPLMIVMLASESGGKSLAELKSRIRHAGPTGQLSHGDDLVNRLTNGGKHIAGMSPLEIAYALLSRMLDTGRKSSSGIHRIDLAALLYLVDQAMSEEADGGNALRRARKSIERGVVVCAHRNQMTIACSDVMDDVSNEIQLFDSLLHSQRLCRDEIPVAAERRDHPEQ